jgi:cellobiose phosphorylase
VEVEDGVIYHKTEYRERRNHFAYFACSEPAPASTPSARPFWAAIGAGTSPQPSKPATDQLHCARLVAHRRAPGEAGTGARRDAADCLCARLPRESGRREVRPARLADHQQETVKPVIAKYLDPRKADAAFERLRQYWDSLLGVFQVNTPDIHTNRMVNIWNAYQCMATFNMSRSASFLRVGNRPRPGLPRLQPGPARLCAHGALARPRAHPRPGRHATATGGAYHQYQPLTKRGNNDIGGGFNDDPHWLIVGVSAYLKETGDWSILDEPVQYDNEPGSEQPLYEHLQRSFNYTLARLGPHGLPLIGRADWNDCLNLNCFSDTPGQSFQTTTNKDGKVAESVFIAGLFVHAGRELAAIANHRGLEAKPQPIIGEPKRWKR